MKRGARGLAQPAWDWPALVQLARTENRLIIGVDEAGRGPLCGPVVAGAAALADPNPIEGLACSKTLSPKRRAGLYAQLTAEAPAWALAEGTVEEIDRLNILQASLLAMHRAVDQVVAQLQLSLDRVLVLVDGNRLPDWPYRSIAVVKGDEKVPAISAGSILAKVSRDRWCETQARLYPQYGLDVHMGYPTPFHLEQLSLHGASPIHRRSFGPVRAVLGNLREEHTP